MSSTRKSSKRITNICEAVLNGDQTTRDEFFKLSCCYEIVEQELDNILIRISLLREKPRRKEHEKLEMKNLEAFYIQMVKFFSQICTRAQNILVTKIDIEK